MAGTTCDYCGLIFNGPGCTPDGTRHYCCYGCYLVERVIGSTGHDSVASWIVLRLGVGAFLAMNVMMISLVLYTQPAEVLGTDNVRGLRWGLAVLSTPAIIILAGPFLLASIKGILQRRVSTDALISTGCLAAYGVSVLNVARGSGHVYFDTATMLPLVITIGRLIETNAKVRTTQAIRDVFGFLPEFANTVRGSSEARIPISEIIEGDIIRVRPGERIPCDGIIIDGSCMVEEAAFSGEPLPRSCSAGDTVYGGSIDCDGVITLRTMGTAEQSLLVRITDMVRRAQEEKAPVERLAERMATAFVPIVWIIAASAFVYWGVEKGDLEKAAMSAMAVLVVACPCALGIATPLVVCIALGKAAATGVVVRSGDVLEKLSGVQRVFFDKTGTLTDTCVAVADMITTGDVNADLALSLAASIASCSEHTASRAIVSEARSRGIEPEPVTDFEVHPGLGASGTVTVAGISNVVTLGSLRLLSQHHQVPKRLADQFVTGPLTTTYAGWGGRVHIAFSLRDTVRAEAQSAIDSLLSEGIEPLMISGDRDEPVSNLAHHLGIETFYSECSPEDKVEIVRNAGKARGRVAMVGDGINDAPALAAADIGIATGSSTDLAKESGDIVILGTDLTRIHWAIGLSRRAYSTIRRNLIWAFGYNLAAMSLAFLGLIHPLIAASAMVISSVTVIANSLRLLR